jgi:dipeptidyl aminopeptidase/acylaminoacyl peptidase
MQRDIRETALYRDAEALFRTIRQPGTGQISDAAELDVAPDGRSAVFAGTIVDGLEGALVSRICWVDLLTGSTRVLTFGPNTDRLPRFSPDGARVAYLSDRLEPGNFQLYLLDPSSGASNAAPHVDGWIEYLHWSPDGTRILLGVAGRGADVAGGQGAVTSKQASTPAPAWLPTVETGDESFRWRKAWLYEMATKRVAPLNANVNIWEAGWCGGHAIAAITSAGAEEGLWYSARLQVIDTASGHAREVYKPGDQLGWPAASPSGASLAVVEAICSDRWFVAGDLLLIDTQSGKHRALDTRGVDVTFTAWRNERTLLVAGHRGFETVVGLYDCAADVFTEVWSSDEISTGGFFATIAGMGAAGDFALIGEGFRRAPEIATIQAGEYRSVRSFDVGYAQCAKAIKAVEQVVWRAPDGLEIQGYLLRPDVRPPNATVMHVHGGPVGHWRPRWLARASMSILMLIKQGYAVFLPNPRGSAGRGQAFARHVVGDMGGADTHDLLSGLDHLIAKGIADPARLGVTGGSYGGFVTAWLITQDSRFAAAIPVAPATNHVTEHLIGNIPEFVALFLADHYTNPSGKYFQRSPIMHAARVRTPTLNICGALDRCTPPEEAIQFHRALRENGVRSVLVIYPEEGHGVRKFPAAIDYVARVAEWFEEHMPATPK